MRRRRMAIMWGPLAALVLAGAPAAWAGPWSPPERLALSVEGAPAIATAPDGTAGAVHMAWDTGGEIVRSDWSGEEWSAPRTIARGAGVAAPRLAAGDGHVVAVWRDGLEVWARVDDAAPARLSADGARAGRPSVGFAPGLGFAALWSEWSVDAETGDVTEHGLVARTLGGGAWSPPVTVAPGDADARVGVDGDVPSAGAGELVFPATNTGPWEEYDGRLALVSLSAAGWSVETDVQLAGDVKTTAVAHLGPERVWALTDITPGSGTLVVPDATAELRVATLDSGANRDVEEGPFPDFPVLLTGAGTVEAYWLRDYAYSQNWTTDRSELMASAWSPAAGWSVPGSVLADTSLWRAGLQGVRTVRGASVLAWAQRKEDAGPWRLWWMAKDVPVPPAAEPVAPAEPQNPAAPAAGGASGGSSPPRPAPEAARPAASGGSPATVAASSPPRLAVPRALAGRLLGVRARVDGRVARLAAWAGRDAVLDLPTAWSGHAIGAASVRRPAGRWRAAIDVDPVTGRARVGAAAGTRVELRLRTAGARRVVTRRVAPGHLVSLPAGTGGRIAWRTPAGPWRVALAVPSGAG